MRRLSLGAVYEAGLLAILWLIVIHAPLVVGLGSLLPEYATVLKAWKEVALAILAVLACVLVTKNELWPSLLRNRLLRLGGLFIGLHLVLGFVLGGDRNAVAAGLMIDLRFIVMFMLMYVLVRLRPQALGRAIKAVAAGAVIVLGFGLLQMTALPDDTLSRLGYSDDTITPYTTIDRNPDFVRINSTLRGPNPLGALCVIYIALATAYLLRKYGTTDMKRRIGALAMIIGSAAVLFASFSRSAYVAAVTAVVVTLAPLRRITKREIIIGAGCLAIVAGGLLIVSSTDWFSNVILHVDPESPVVSKSNGEHVTSLVDGASRIIAQPIGAGIGSTGSASLYDGSARNDVVIENYYFFVAHESGWLGLLVFLALFLMVLRTLWKMKVDWFALGLFASGIGLAIIGLLLPVWADETVAIIWWGLAGAVMASESGIIGGRHATGTRQQKATRASSIR